MAVVLDAVSHNGAITSVSSLTISHTMGSGANGILYCTFSQDVGVGVTSVTWNGGAMTLLTSIASASAWKTFVYYKVGPASGTHDIVITPASAVNGITAVNVSYTGVDQATPNGANGTSTGNSQTPNKTFTTTYDNSMVVGACGYNVSSANVTAADGCTLESSDDGDTFNGESQYVEDKITTTAGSYTLSLSGNSTRQWAFIAFEVKAAATAAATPHRLSLMGVGK